MKRIKFTLICTTALMLAASFAGCMHGDSGNATTPDVDKRIETQMDENGDCPDGKCPEESEGKTDKLPEDRDGNDGCPNGRCPVRLLPPKSRHGVGRTAPMPRPHRDK